MAIVGVGIECVGKKALDPRADRMLGRRPSAAGRGAVIEPLSTGPLERSRQLQAGVRKWADARRAAGTAVSQTQITERARPEYIMAHSLSHALTSEVAIDCGYPASAL